MQRAFDEKNRVGIRPRRLGRSAGTRRPPTSKRCNASNNADVHPLEILAPLDLTYTRSFNDACVQFVRFVASTLFLPQSCAFTVDRYDNKVRQQWPIVSLLHALCVRKTRQILRLVYECDSLLFDRSTREFLCLKVEERLDVSRRKRIIAFFCY